MYLLSAFAVALSLLLSGATPAITQSSPGKVSQRASKSVPCGAGIVSLDEGDLYNTKPRNMDYIVMEPWEHKRIPAMRKANPKAKILMYKNLSSVRTDRSYEGSSSTGLTADQMAEGWFLHDKNGNRATWADYSELYAANISIRTYQQKWLSEVTKDLRQGKWDGVMIDDTLTTLSHPLVGGGVPRELPTDAHMYKATESALKYIGPRLKKNGYFVMPNITVFWDNWERPIKTWAKYVSGWENEFLVKWGLENMERFQESNDWKWKYDMATWLAKNKIPLLGITYSNKNDRATQLYHRATWLLTWNGKQGASAFVPYENETNHVTKLANLKLGTPKAKAKHLASGLYARSYSRGLTLVNPTPKTITFKLNRAYRNVYGKRVTTVRLAPSTGQLLFKGKVPSASCR